MKIVFNNELDYQNDAISAVTELFKGQERAHSLFTIYDPQKYNYDHVHHHEGGEIGISNKLHIDNDDILENLNRIRVTNHLKPIEKLKHGEYNFAIEMETGTGKTFVYLKTIFELRKQYGFTKFIILVPSVAIKEGVLASLKMLKSHFEYHYKDFPFHFFQYRSDKLHELMDFARNDTIEIMVMTIQSLDSDNKVLNTTNQTHLEKTNGVKPIEIIKRCNPIVIIDEPQTTSSSEGRKKYIEQLNALCTLQYSATHKKEQNVHKIYRLTSIDAYLLKLVKQIEVASVISKNDHNLAYVKLIEVKATSSKSNSMTAKVEIDVLNEKNADIERKTVTIKSGDNLYDISGRREIYANMIIGTLRRNVDRQSITIGEHDIFNGEALNAFDDDNIKRTQIRKTIEEHFEKERRLNPLGIKVLSLFFIDKVANYRSWDVDTPLQGKFAKWFEEEYIAIREKYKKQNEINAIDTPVSSVHQGYFAEDKKKHFKNTQGSSEADIKAYESIMKDKESLLSFDNPIRFIFSHSALREGWDNPNVFQICTLNDSVKSNDRKRQEIGRGLRLAVKQDGERVYGFEVNTLTVMANQSYEEYARLLQLEIEKDEGFTFGSISPNSFVALSIEDVDKEISIKESSLIYDFFNTKQYINSDGNITDNLKSALYNKKLELPQEVEKYRWEITEYLKKVCGSINIKPKGTQVKYKQNKRIVDDCPYFTELWSRIKQKTKYSVNYETDELIKNCVIKMKDLQVNGIEIEYKKTKIIHNSTGLEGITTTQDANFTVQYNRHLPDIISFLQNNTNLTRKTIIEILSQSGTLYLFYLNPQRYMTDVAKVINDTLLDFIIGKISYKPIAESEYYLQEVFPDEELEKAIDTLVKSDKSVYEYNYCESEPERKFSKAMNELSDVVLYTKLPTRKFVVPTPIGEYSPDWAVVLKDNNKYNLYFVVETKSSLDHNERRSKENNKIRFGQKRFEDVGGVGYFVATNKDDFIVESKYFTDIDGKTKRTTKTTNI